MSFITFLTLIVVPVVYTIMHESIPGFFGRIGVKLYRTPEPTAGLLKKAVD